MRLALELAREAAKDGEVPVGCVIADGDGNIVGKGRNRREAMHTALGHAELEAIHTACRTLGSWRLEDCTLFVTLEPCPMCAGAILNARIPRIVFGARDPVMGACGSVLDLFFENFGHRPAVLGGVLADEAGALLREFFRSLRNR